MYSTDICIAGAGIIGLSLALELDARGLRVTVVEVGTPLREASFAAAGMLAASDPENPDQLRALAQMSISLYPKFLERLKTLGKIDVPFQTSRTFQRTQPTEKCHDVAEIEARLRGEEWQGGSFVELQEDSLDPRELAGALMAAVKATRIRIVTDTARLTTSALEESVVVQTSRTSSAKIEAEHFVDCTGAWANDKEYSVRPMKGQMLAVAIPGGMALDATVRTREFYIVPRTRGMSSGRAIIGATIEDAGFDKTIEAKAIQELHKRAAALLPGLAGATVLESWAGLRPATRDKLPLIGPHPMKQRHWVATGHFRNGILLAPATARVMAQTILGEATSVSLEEFKPSRAQALGAART